MSKNSPGSDPSVSRSSRDAPLLSCQLCGMAVNDREDLLQHLAWVHPEQRRSGVAAVAPQKTYCCLLCDAEFGHRDELQNHVQIIHSQGVSRISDVRASQDSQESEQASKRRSLGSWDKGPPVDDCFLPGQPYSCYPEQRVNSIQAQSALQKTQVGCMKFLNNGHSIVDMNVYCRHNFT